MPDRASLAPPALPYVRGEILRSTEDDLAKLRRAWREIARRGEHAEPVYDFTGLERALRVEPSALESMDDELAPAILSDRLRELALDHLGGDPAVHDAFVCNRLTAALVASVLCLVQPGDAVVGFSAGYTHPALRRAVALAGGRLVDTTTVGELESVLETEPDVTLVALTRLAVTYELLAADDVERALALARSAGVRVLVDDAGGARVAPAVFGHPRTLELGVDLGATGLDKYGTTGPRLGLLAGRRELVGEIRARAFELGLEARPLLYPAVVASLESYDPERVRTLVATTAALGAALRRRLDALVTETPVSVQLRGEDVRAEALRRAGAGEAAIVPYEATAALAMLLLREHGILTVHFAAVPPGTSALLLKFVQPETLERFGGADRFTAAVDDALDRLAAHITDEGAARELLLGA